MKIEVTASLGSNVEPKANICGATRELRALFPGLQASPVYESPAVGFEGANFLNLVVAFETELPLSSLRLSLEQIESNHGRHRTGRKYSNRTLDIDILTFGETVGTVAGMNLPREDITRFAFVLKPLADIRPNTRHPKLDISYAELWRKFTDKDKQPLTKLFCL
jgi:2-amino-4-hydroxy-6-hydroxymethyldihydropteridine diphosphokinase